ncbi:DUF1273 domain-containing protein [Lactobacillaceae bacterium L1_55_11]|nr:DUF1273 domain-containing protein [Lactobacillaceae bacterium L1_55_11]
MSRLWVSGYRSYELSVFSNQDPKLKVIRYALERILRDYFENGVDWVITGGQPGIEQWVVTAVKDLQADYPEVKVAMLLPFEEFGSQWKPERQQQLATLKSQADFVTAVYRGGYQNGGQLAQYQRFIMDNTDLAHLVYDREYPGKTKFELEGIERYQRQAPYPLALTGMDDLQEYANDYQESQQPW